MFVPTAEASIIFTVIFVGLPLLIAVLLVRVIVKSSRRSKSIPSVLGRVALSLVALVMLAFAIFVILRIFFIQLFF